ncbi:uncharacterized protein L3040_004204 [Drepanopeziza brunnea f. sp. 'multigermtubi']|nr:hypothetical protein L3040_004204 [Drepanopeziza brunnea f. sp. 'multigermtubi']
MSNMSNHLEQLPTGSFSSPEFQTTLQGMISQQNSTLLQIHMANSALYQQLAQQNAELAQQKRGTLKLAETHEAENKMLKGEAAILRKQLGDAEERVANVRAEIAVLAQQKAKWKLAEAQEAEDKMLKGEAAILRKQLGNAEERIANLRAENEALRKKPLPGEMGRLKRQSETMEGRLVKSTGRISELERIVKDLRATAELKEPLYQVGIDVRKGLWEKWRALSGNFEPNAELVKKRDRAANEGNWGADSALLNLGYISSSITSGVSNGGVNDLFFFYYVLKSDWARLRFPRQLIQAADCWASITVSELSAEGLSISEDGVQEIVADIMLKISRMMMADGDDLSVEEIATVEAVIDSDAELVRKIHELEIIKNDIVAEAWRGNQRRSGETPHQSLDLLTGAL